METKSPFTSPLKNIPSFQTKKSGDTSKPTPKKNKTLLYSVLCALILSLFIVYPKYTEYSQAKINIVNNIESIPVLENQEKQLQVKLTEIEKTLKEENKEELRILEKVLPKEPTTTDIVRLFDSFAFNFNTANNPLYIHTISFNDVKTENGEKFIDMNLKITASKQNFERFMYLIETSGTLRANELINESELESLKEILSTEEKNALENILNQDYDRRDIINYINRINASNLKKTLINDLFTKPLFYKELQNFVEERYYPIPTFAAQEVSFKTEENSERSQIEGEISLNLQLRVYFNNIRITPTPNAS